MTTKGSPRLRWVSLFGMFMLLLSVTPSGMAAQTGLAPVGDVAQTAGQAIEVHVVDCPPGTPDDPSDLSPGCTDGRAGLNLNVSSTNASLGINQDKVTVKASDPGPGIINTGEIPLGQYRIEIDLPTDENNFFFECRYQGSITNDVPVTPDPNGAPNAFLVDNDANSLVVCDAWIIPSGENPTMEITYRECARADFPSDSREFADLQNNCTNVSTNPPTFNVRNVTDVPAGTDTTTMPADQHQLDAEGKLDLTLEPGNYELFTNLDMDEYGEYLFCEYQGQPLYEKDFDPNRGITTFTNLLPGEEFTCHWFGVSATGDADTPAEEAPAEGTESESTAANQQAQQQQVQQLAEEDVQFTINFNNCTRGDFPNDDRSLASLQDNCTFFEAPGPTFTIEEESDASQTQHNLDANGVLTFTHAPTEFFISTNLDLNSWGEYLYCSVDGGALTEQAFSDVGIAFFSGLTAGTQVECNWFAVQAVETPTEGADAPADVIEPPANEQQATTSTINLTLIACQANEATWDTSSLDAFRNNCEGGVENMVFNLFDQSDNRLGGVTLPNGEATIADIPAGDWRLWSEIPLEAATEYYFCSTDGGAYSAMTLSDRGVASFTGLDGQQIDCEIYVVPKNLRGEVTGSSVEVHLSICPTGYEGSSWYADCHDNGTDGQEFTIADANGEITKEAVVERTPGPAIVRFTELPAGEFELRGGPPQDFGSVFLYCSDPATNEQVSTRFEGGMGYFTLAENQSIICDWYFVPEDGSGLVTPTPEPTSAEIFTTMFICPPDVNVAGSTFSQLDSACSDRLNDVPMTLQRPGGVPLTANTGASGDGAVRFYELTGGDYVLTPKLPAEYVSAAVYCDLDGVNVYQKAIANGGTTFVNLEDELVSCSWFVTEKPQEAPGPTGSITVREMLCEGDRATIQDWERECQPASSGVSFTLTSTSGDISQTLTPNADGVAVFSGLPNGYYELKQSEGAWCRARAERVDSQSRLGVANGGNTDVFIYQCNQELGLPDTGTGTPAGKSDVSVTASIMLGIGSLPMFAVAAWQLRRWQLATTGTESEQVHAALTRTRDGYRYR